MTTVTLQKYSVLQSTPIYQTEDGIVPGVIQQVVFPDATDEVFTVTVSFQNDWQKIASTVYGVADLWWVLAQLNNITDPMYGLPVGVKIRVATKSRLQNLGVL